MTENAIRQLAPLHLLLVDDDPMAIDIFETHYQQYGFTIETASDGDQALRLMEARMPDIVLCDRVMPGLSGAELLKVVRDRSAEPGQEQWRHPIFIFVTALSDRRDRYAMMPLCPDAYLTKPIILTEADRIILDVVNKRRTGNS